jgi:hypothetical protein
MELPRDAHTTYDPHDPVEDEFFARKHALVREVKRLIEVVAHLDVREADAAQIEARTAELRRTADALEPLPSLLAKGGLGAIGGDDGALLERSGISGRSNPLAPPVQWVRDGDTYRGYAFYSPAYEGPSGSVHGGFVAAAFDDLLGAAR